MLPSPAPRHTRRADFFPHCLFRLTSSEVARLAQLTANGLLRGEAGAHDALVFSGELAHQDGLRGRRRCK